MRGCTFFGHRDTPSEAEELLKETVIDLIEKEGIKVFYVGNHGSFDNMVKKCLISLKKDYPDIVFYIVLAYIPEKT